MISGSDYYMPIAIDDKPLSADQQKLELQTLDERSRPPKSRKLRRKLGSARSNIAKRESRTEFFWRSSPRRSTLRWQEKKR